MKKFILFTCAVVLLCVAIVHCFNGAIIYTEQQLGLDLGDIRTGRIILFIIGGICFLEWYVRAKKIAIIIHENNEVKGNILVEITAKRKKDFISLRKRYEAYLERENIASISASAQEWRDKTHADWFGINEWLSKEDANRIKESFSEYVTVVKKATTRRRFRT